MSRFPENKGFAFAIYDDTDVSTTAISNPVYQLIIELGVRYDIDADAQRVSPVMPRRVV
jgi:hypothetical protein